MSKKDKDDDWPPQIDLFGAREARDEGMKKVASRSPDYIDGGMALIANLPNGSEATGEDIRLKCITSGLRYHHPNAHGTLIRMAVERGMLRHTGKWQQPKVKNSHGRKIPIYRIRSVLQPLPPAPSSPSPDAPLSPGPTNAYYDEGGRLIHDTCGVKGCTKSPGHSVGRALLKGDLGMWYCEEHFELMRRV
jgi:hypothetical protein